MRKILSASACALGLAVASIASPAQAQSYTWTWNGFYIGLDAGFAANRSLVSFQASTSTPAPPLSPAQVGVFNANGIDTLTARGFEGGGHIGFNWHMRPFVVGIEADFGAFRTNGTRDYTAFPLPAGATFHTEVSSDWLATLRPRVGWAQNVLFGYLTGGVAVAQFKTNASYIDNSGANGAVSASQVKAGWTIGAGLEVAIASQWMLRFEYFHVEFPSINVTGRITNPVTGAFNPIAL